MGFSKICWIFSTSVVITYWRFVVTALYANSSWELVKQILRNDSEDLYVSGILESNSLGWYEWPRPPCQAIFSYILFGQEIKIFHKSSSSDQPISELFCVEVCWSFWIKYTFHFFPSNTSGTAVTPSIKWLELRFYQIGWDGCRPRLEQTLFRSRLHHRKCSLET
jgi:hypothetical protein